MLLHEKREDPSSGNDYFFIRLFITLLSQTFGIMPSLKAPGRPTDDERGFEFNHFRRSAGILEAFKQLLHGSLTKLMSRLVDRS